MLDVEVLEVGHFFLLLLIFFISPVETVDVEAGIFFHPELRRVGTNSRQARHTAGIDQIDGSVFSRTAGDKGKISSSGDFEGTSQQDGSVCDDDGSGDLEVTADLKIFGDHKRSLLGVFRNKLTVFIKSRFTRSTDDDVEGLTAGIKGLGYPPAVVALKNVRETSKGRFKSFTAGKTRLVASEASFYGTSRAATIASLDVAVVTQFGTSDETITALGDATSESGVTHEGYPGDRRLRGGLS